MAELTAPPTEENINPDNKLMVLIQNVLPIANWNDFNSFPKWRLKEMIAFYSLQSEEDKFHNYVSKGIINVFNAVMKDMGGGGSQD